MKNISIDNEPIFLNAQSTYIVIDALYLTYISEGYSEIDFSNFKFSVKEKIFPYLDTPFGEYEVSNSFFLPNQIIKVPSNDFNIADKTIFSTDTSLIIFVESSVFSQIAKSFDYYELVDTKHAYINEKYWNNITSLFHDKQVGLILAPGIGKGVDFDGSGTYKIVV